MDKISIAKMKLYPVGYVNAILSSLGKKGDVKAPSYPEEDKFLEGHLSEEDMLKEFSARGLEAVLYKV